MNPDFFLHDECARALLEYETARAHIETIKFRTSSEGNEFETLLKLHGCHWGIAGAGISGCDTARRAEHSAYGNDLGLHARYL